MIDLIMVNNPNQQSLKEISSNSIELSGVTMPHSLEAEEALLGSILVDNEVYNRIIFEVPLEPSHFYLPLNSRIFEGIKKLVNQGQIADPITLAQYFEKDVDLIEINDANYLYRLTETAETISGADHYAKLIYDLSIRRELIRLGQNVVSEASNADIDDTSMSLIETAESNLFSLAESGENNKGPIPFEESVVNALNNAEIAHKRDGQLSGVSTGLSAMNELLGGLHKSDLIVLAGRPSMGKTALATNIAFHASSDDKEEGAILFFSLEMSSEQLTNRILAEQAGVSSENIRRGKLNNEQFIELVRASKNITNRKLFIDETPAISIPQVRTRARRIKRLHKLNLIVLDYLQLMLAINKSNNRVQEISEITQGLKAIAKELNVPILALSQLSRAVEQREDKRPHLADLRESGTIEQDSDVVMFVYRQAYYEERSEPIKISTETEEKFQERYLNWQDTLEKVQNIADVIVAKQRHGPIGNIKLHFEPSITKFTDLADKEQYPDA